MKRLALLFALLVGAAAVAAGAFFLGSWWQKNYGPREGEAEALRTRLQKECLADPTLAGVVVKTAKPDGGQLALRGLVARTEQIARLEGLAGTVIAERPDLQADCPNGASAAGMSIVALKELLPAFQRDFATGGSGPQRVFLRQTRLDDVAVGEDGRVTYAGAATPGKADEAAVRQAVRQSIQDRLGELGVRPENLPEIDLQIRVFDDPAVSAQAGLAREPRLQGTQLVLAWYDAAGKLNVAATVAKTGQEALLLEHLLKEWQGGDARALLGAHAEFVLHAVRFDPAEEARKLQQQLAAQNNPVLRLTRLDRAHVRPARDEAGRLRLDAGGAFVRTLAAEGKLLQTGAALKELHAWLGQQLPQLGDPALQPSEADVSGVKQADSPVGALQKLVADPALDGTLFEQARYDGEGRLHLEGYLSAADARPRVEELARPLLEAETPWTLDDMRPHRAAKSGAALTWAEVVRGCQRELAEDAAGRRARVDRLYFGAGDAGAPPLLGEGVFLEGTAGGKLDAVLRAALLRVVQLPPRTAIAPDVLPGVKSPVHGAQKSVAGDRRLDGTFLARASYDGAGSLLFEGFLGRPGQTDRLAELLQPLLQARPELVRPGRDAADPGWSLARMAPYKTADGADLPWAEVLRALQRELAGDRGPVLRQTRVERGFFDYAEARPQLTWQVVHLATADTEGQGKQLGERLRDSSLKLLPLPGDVEVVTVTQAVPSPLAELQDAVVRQRLDGVLVRKAFYDEAGRLCLEACLGALSQRVRVGSLAEEVLAGKPALGRTGVGPVEAVGVLPYPDVLHRLQADFARSNLPLLRQTRLDRAYFRQDADAAKAQLHFQGVCTYADRSLDKEQRAEGLKERLTAEIVKRELPFEVVVRVEEIEQKPDPLVELQQQAEERKLDGVLFRKAWFDPAGRLQLDVQVDDDEQRQAVEKMIAEAVKKYPYLQAPKAGAAPKAPGADAATGRPGGEFLVALTDRDEPEPKQAKAAGDSAGPKSTITTTGHRERLRQLQKRLAGPRLPLLQQVRIDRAYFRRVAGDDTPLLRVEGACLLGVDETKQGVVPLLEKELQAQFPEVTYRPDVSPLAFEESPVYALQEGAVKDGLGDLLFERAAFDGAGKLYLNVLLLGEARRAQAEEVLKKRPPGPPLLAPGQAAAELRAVAVDWPAILQGVREQFAQAPEPLLQRTRLDRAYAAYAADRRKVELRFQGVCLHPAGLLTQAQREQELRKRLSGLIAELRYEPVVAGVEVVANPAIDLQDEAARRDLDGVLIGLARYDAKGVLHFPVRRPENVTDEDLEKVLDQKPLGARVAPAGKEVHYSAWDWKALLHRAQARLAAGERLARRTRIDRAHFTYHAPDGTPLLHFHGLCLQQPARAAREVHAILAGELAGLLAEVDYRGTAEKVALPASPVYPLQQEAVLRRLDGVLFDDAFYDADGKLHLRTLLGSAAQEKDVREVLESSPVPQQLIRPAKDAGQPVVETQVLHWDLFRRHLQETLGDSPDAGLRKVRLDRASFAYPPDGAGPELRLEVVRIDDGDRGVPERLARRATTAARFLLADHMEAAPTAVLAHDGMVAHPAPLVQARVPAETVLDGVRVDDASFDAQGKLVLSGLWLGQKQTEPLSDLVEKVLTPASPLLKRGYSWKQMRDVRTDELLAQLRRWVADNNDLEEVWLERLYFDEAGRLKLVGFYARADDRARVHKAAHELFSSHPARLLKQPRPAAKGDSAAGLSLLNLLGVRGAAVLLSPLAPVLGGEGLGVRGPGGVPPPHPQLLSPEYGGEGSKMGPSPPNTGERGEVCQAADADDTGDFLDLQKVPSLTAFLRAQVPQQTRFDGLRLDRGYYSAQGQFRIDGLEDRPGQMRLLGTFLEGEEASAKWPRYLHQGWAPGRTTVVPVAPMLECLAEVLPGAPQFDGLRLTRAFHAADNRLVFTGPAVGPADPQALAPQLKTLLDRHARWRLRGATGVGIEVVQRQPADKDLASRLTLRSLRQLKSEIGAAHVEPVWPLGRVSSAAAAKKARSERGDWPEESDYVESLDRLETALLHDPGNVTAWYLRAHCHLARGRADLARRDLRRMARLETADPELRLQRLVALELVQGEVRQAAARLEQDAIVEVGRGEPPLSLELCRTSEAR